MQNQSHYFHVHGHLEIEGETPYTINAKRDNLEDAMVVYRRFMNQYPQEKLEISIDEVTVKNIITLKNQN